MFEQNLWKEHSDQQVLTTLLDRGPREGTAPPPHRWTIFCGKKNNKKVSQLSRFIPTIFFKSKDTYKMFISFHTLLKKDHPY